MRAPRRRNSPAPRSRMVPALGRHAQSLEPEIHAGRLVRRLGGASLASGTTAIATGSDIGGSIRIPASCLRRRRLQAALRPQSGRSALQPRSLLPHRPAGPHGRRRDPAAERDVRAEPARHREPAAEAAPADRTTSRSRAGASPIRWISASSRSTRRWSPNTQGGARRVPLARRHGRGGRSRLDHRCARQPASTISIICSARRWRRYCQEARQADDALCAWTSPSSGAKSKAADFLARDGGRRRDVRDARADAGEIRRADLPDRRRLPAVRADFDPTQR